MAEEIGKCKLILGRLLSNVTFLTTMEWNGMECYFKWNGMEWSVILNGMEY